MKEKLKLDFDINYIHLQSSQTKINKLGTKLDALYQQFKSNPSQEIKRKIVIYIASARELTENLRELFQAIFNNNNPKYIPVLLQFSNFLGNLSIMESKIKLMKTNLDTPKKSIAGFDDNLMPSTALIINLCSSRIKEGLTRSGSITDDQINAILVKNSQFLSESLYRESNSLLYNKYEGMTGHYLQLMQENEKLWNENQELRNEIKKSNSLIQETEALINENKLLKEVFENKISKLKDNNASLRKTIEKLKTDLNASENKNSKYQSLISENQNQKPKKHGESLFFKTKNKHTNRANTSHEKRAREYG